MRSPGRRAAVPGVAVALTCAVAIADAAGPGPAARPSASRGAAAQGELTRAAPRPARRIRGKVGYGLRRSRPRPLTERQLEYIRGHLEEEEEGRDTKPGPGPFPGPRKPATTESGGEYPFLPGRRSDEPNV